MSAVLTAAPRTVRAPRGPERTCKGWVQEAALRMLMNNLDPEVAEDPDRLVVYGGSGKAARTWQDFDRIVAALRKLDNDETLLVQSGKPVAVSQDLQRLMFSDAIGQPLAITVMRNGALVDVIAEPTELVAA